MRTDPPSPRFGFRQLCLSLVLILILGAPGSPMLIPSAEAAPPRVVKRLKKKIKKLKRQLIVAQGAVPSNPVPLPPPPTPGMVLIPAGNFVMGDESAGGGEVNELPTRALTISAFYIDRFEVTKGLWDVVAAWGAMNGYSDLPAGGGQGQFHPVHSVHWYDSVKWCNARSEMEGLTPVYYADAAHATVFRTGTISLPESFVKWTANGFRLPTEAEWEKAARGNVAGMAYPWGDTIERSDANSAASGDPFDGVTPATTPVGFYDGGQLPAGPDRANGYGLYDMAGNLYEWCWDVFSSTWYGDPGARSVDPRGPPVTGGGNPRVWRGGWHGGVPDTLRCAKRSLSTPTGGFNGAGFRTVRGR